MSHESHKEIIRKEMIEWSDEIRRVQPGYFCKATCEKGFFALQHKLRFGFIDFSLKFQLWLNQYGL